MERSVEATTLVEASFERVGELLLRDPIAAIGSTTTLGVVLGGVVHVECDVEVAVRDPLKRDDEVAIPISWRAVHHAGLVPSFDGELGAEPSIAGSRLWLRGTYRIPLGPVGRFGDGVAGRRLARQSLQALLSHVASRINGATEGTADISARTVALVEAEHPELHIG